MSYCELHGADGYSLVVRLTFDEIVDFFDKSIASRFEECFQATCRHSQNALQALRHGEAVLKRSAYRNLDKDAATVSLWRKEARWTAFPGICFIVAPLASLLVSSASCAFFRQLRSLELVPRQCAKTVDQASRGLDPCPKTS